MECCTTLDFSLITKLEKYLCRSVNCSWQTATLQKQHSPSIAFDEEADGLNSQNKSLFFFLHMQFTRFQTKILESPGTYISGRTWDLSQKSYCKTVDKTTRCV